METDFLTGISYLKFTCFHSICLHGGFIVNIICNFRRGRRSGW